MKCRALSDPAGRVHIALHGLNEVLDNGQAQAGAAQFARAGLVDAIEALEYSRQILLRDADAGVRHLQMDSTLRAPPAYADASAGRGIFEGVVDQVPQDLVERILVRPGDYGRTGVSGQGPGFRGRRLCPLPPAP